jgi:hypothetical protein
MVSRLRPKQGLLTFVGRCLSKFAWAASWLTKMTRFFFQYHPTLIEPWRPCVLVQAVTLYVQVTKEELHVLVAHGHLKVLPVLRQVSKKTLKKKNETGVLCRYAAKELMATAESRIPSSWNQKESPSMRRMLADGVSIH